MITRDQENIIPSYPSNRDKEYFFSKPHNPLPRKEKKGRNDFLVPPCIWRFSLNDGYFLTICRLYVNCNLILSTSIKASDGAEM